MVLQFIGISLTKHGRWSKLKARPLWNGPDFENKEHWKLWNENANEEQWLDHCCDEAAEFIKSMYLSVCKGRVKYSFVTNLIDEKSFKDLVNGPLSCILTKEPVNLLENIF